jgi:hypothetical protein
MKKKMELQFTVDNSHIRAIRGVQPGEAEPGDTVDWGGTIARACWYNLELDELVPADSPIGDSEHDFPALYWVIGLD